MESYGDKNIKTVSERPSDGFRITVESEASIPNFSSLRNHMSPEVRMKVIEKTAATTSKRTTISTLDLKICNGRLEMKRSVDGGIQMNLTFSDLVSYSDRFFTDEKVNKDIQKFLSDNFPNDFERTKTYTKLLEAWAARNENSVSFEEFFNPDAKTVENYSETFLMALGYGFPALFNRLPYDITSEAMFEVASDMKSFYCEFMTASTESELADMAFGTRRKTFRRLTPLLTVSELSLVQQLSKIVSADTLEWALRGVDFSSSRPVVDCWYSDAEVLANFSSTIQRNLVRDLFVINSTDADDAFDMVQRYVTDYTFFKGVKTIEQLHNKAMTVIPEITEDSRIEKVDHSILSSREVFIPEISSKLELLVNQKEFVRIGKELKICIGSASYFEKSINGESYCYKILKDGALIGALEVAREQNEWKSVQCRGEHNRKLDTEAVIVEKLLNRLEETPAAFSFAGVS